MWRPRPSVRPSVTKPFAPRQPELSEHWLTDRQTSFELICTKLCTFVDRFGRYSVSKTWTECLQSVMLRQYLFVLSVSVWLVYTAVHCKVINGCGYNVLWWVVKLTDGA
jgi:hypothetical protein